MGIYDREYVRVGPRSASGLGGMRAWSVNTWLIVINVAVFVISNALMTTPSMRRPLPLTPVPFDGVGREVIARGGWDPAHFNPRVMTVQSIPVSVLVSDQQGRNIRLPDGTLMSHTVGFLQVQNVSLLEYWGHFSTGRGFLPGLEVWRFITFQFLHANLMHIVFNMMGLWFVGGLVEQYLGGKRYLAFYLTCGIFGALMYLLLNLGGTLLPGARIPGLLFEDIFTPLVGASAGIFGVLMAAAFIAPNAIVQVMFVVPMRLRTAVYVFTAIALWSLVTGSTNAGGEAAHIGGAIAGFFFIRRMHLLRDFFDILGDSRKGVNPGVVRRARPSAEELDRILKKVHAQGLASLSEGEKSALRRATESGGR